jgi:hypothetical protein
MAWPQKPGTIAALVPGFFKPQPKINLCLIETKHAPAIFETDEEWTSRPVASRGRRPSTVI